ncbi:DUF4282 domain-containing protein [Prosthecomicrobium sp. N25]|uniref:DUF4282 domain-containing protein n=1 Tax=Prosthecomicrobium sp. N25 TaxID=3129254 RepID=UPI003077556A
MLSKFLTLDEFITPGLVRRLYPLGLALIALGALLDIMVSLVSLSLIGLLWAIIRATMAFIVLRVMAELYFAIFRLHDRFVGGHPKDPIPE